MSYSIELREEATITALVSSNFVTVDLSLRVTGLARPVFACTRRTECVDSSRCTFVKFRYHRLYFQIRCSDAGGLYQLAIIQPKGTMTTRCGQFEFELHVVAGGVSNTCPADEVHSPVVTFQCFMCLRSLNISYPSRSTRCAIWAATDVHTFRAHTTLSRPLSSLPLTPSLCASLCRHCGVQSRINDIDLKLYRNGTLRVLSALVASAVSYNEEESLSYTLEPGLAYELDIMFFRWGRGATCDSFGMELAVVPLTDLAPALAEELCPGYGADRAPQVPAQPPLPYKYTDTVDLFMQQRIDEPRRVAIPLTLTSLSRMYAAVGGKFEEGAPSVRLERNGTAVAVAHSSTNRRSLIVEDLAPGDYAGVV